MNNQERRARAFCEAVMVHRIETGKAGNITRDELAEAVEREWREFIRPMNIYFDLISKSPRPTEGADAS